MHQRNVRRNTRVQPADHLVKNGFLLADRFAPVGLGGVETVLLVHQFPDGSAVVVGERLYV